MARKHKKQASYVDANVVLDATLSLGSIREPGGLDEANSWISCHASRLPPQEFECIIRGLSASPEVLVLLLVSCSELLQVTTARLLEGSQFPSTTESYRDSCQGIMLIAFHEFWSSFQPPGDVEAVEFQLHTMTISDAHILISEELDSAFKFEDSPPPSSHGRKKRKQQHAQNHLTPTPVSLVAQNALKCLGEEPPRNLDEKHHLIKRLLDRQEATLKYFLLDILTRTTTELHVKTVVLRVVDAPEISGLTTIQDTSNRPYQNQEPLTAEPGFEEPDAFSQILPANARHMFETPDGWGDWHLFLAGRAIKHLRNFRKTAPDKFHIVEAKIKQLSQGFFSPSNQKYLVGGPADVRIFEAKLSRDLRLVYRIDLQTDDQVKIDRQVILIHGIYTHAQLDRRLWAQVAHFSPHGDAEYRRRCEYRAQKIVHGSKMNTITSPMTWAHEDYTVSAKPPPPGYNEEDFLELHRICALEKFVPLTNALLHTIMADEDAIHQFAVSPSEKKIINHKGSCFVVGRSGTGKTTTMVFKMLGVEMTNRRMQPSDPTSRSRQMFITQSHVLAGRVEEYYTELLHATKCNTRQRRPAEDLLALDEDADERDDLPAKFSDLEDKHFPLFATFDQVRRMLENDLSITFSRKKAIQRRKRANLPVETTDDLNVDLMSLMQDPDLDPSGSESVASAKSHFVSFSVFLTKYWPHFDQKLTKGLDPALVFSEIMAVIRGHERTLGSEGGCLDKELYLSLSDRTHSSLSRHRERVYSICETYIRMKQENGMFDSPDRTHDILRAFRNQIPGKVDFLYVDEVQDLLIIDAKLLWDLCSNPCGFFWGGDTAQSINVGSSFRIEDLKALTWREEESHPHVKAKLRKPIHPDTFQLLTNYRSHGGIVDCAASLIELLSSMFPYSIDKLKRESALVTGPKPRIFLSDVVHFEEFLKPDSYGGSRLDFGAHQAIIVRDDAAALRLYELVGGKDCIYTLLNCKGLEFDDVLLYDFFASSPASTKQWRVINSDLHDFDKHRILESELKRLYVAITRARHHCWIWESKPLQHPMIEYWTTRELARLHAPDDPRPALATRSTPQQWNERGRELFQRKLYPQAVACFEKAGRFLDRDISKAYELHEHARRSTTDQDRSFARAADEFRHCAESALHNPMAPRLYKKAGECFVQAKDLRSAAECYAFASEFTTAARLYRKAGMFDEAIDLIKSTDGQPSGVDKTAGDEIIHVAKVEYARTSNFQQMKVVFDGKIDEQLEFMELYGLQRERISLLMRLGDYRAAGELHQQLGELECAAECFLQSKETEVRRRAISSVLESLKRVAFGVTFTQESMRTLQLLDNVSEDDFDYQDKIMVKIFRAMSNGDRAGLQALAHRNRNDDSARLLCENQAIFCPGFSMETLELRELLHEMEFEWPYYSSLLSMVKSSENLCYQTDAALLLGIRPATGPGREHLIDCFTVEKESYLGRAFKKKKSQTLPRLPGHQDQDTAIVLSSYELDRLAREAIEADMKASLLGLHEKLKWLSVLRPCIGAAIYRSCNRDGCARDHSAITLPDYPSLMVRVVLQIICTVNLLWSLSRPAKWREIHWTWIRRLFEAFQPLTHRLGCATLHYGVPSGQESVRIVQKWINDLVFDVWPGSREYLFLSDCIQLSWMVGTMYDLGVPHYFGRAGIIHRYPDLVREGRVSIVEDLLAAIARLHPDQRRLTRGVLAIKHIIDKQLQIDLLFLVSYLEQLALEILITAKQNSGRGWDGLLLPRSWVLRLIRGPERSPCWDPSLSDLFESTGKLMSRVFLWNGAGCLLLGSGVLPTAALPRNLLLERVCRFLVITGYNGYPGVRADIHRTITASLNTGEAKHSFLYAKYASARNWRDLANALLESGTPKDHDHLLLLRELPGGYSKPISNVRTVAFRNRKDIDDALFPQENLSTSNSRASPQAEAPSTSAMQLHNASAPTDATMKSRAIGVDVIIRPSLEVTGARTRKKDDGDIVEDPSDNVGSGETMELRPRPEEESAAQRIQLWYRRSLHRRNSTRDVALAKHHAECVADLPNILNHPSRRYLAVVRGPMPHALCALDKLLGGVAERKKMFLRNLTDVPHQELERAQGMVDNVNAIMREGRNLRQSIAPGGDVFRSGDMGNLRAAVKKVAILAEQAREEVGVHKIEAMHDHIYIAFKGIVKTPPVPAPASHEEKPELNTDDMWDCE